MTFEITHSGTANSFTITADNQSIVNVVQLDPIIITIALQRDGIDGKDAVPAVIDGGFIY